jgi:glycosyltransferase involved in cell wall biosynthesis
MKEKIRVALMTYAIDGRPAKGTAVVARKCTEVLLEARDRFELTFIHFDRSDDPIYGHGVREVVLPEIYPRFLNRRSLRLLRYFLSTRDRYDIVHWFQPRMYPFFWLAPTTHIVVTAHGAGDMTPENDFIPSRSIFNWTMKHFHHKISIAIAGSRYAAADIIKYYGFDQSQLRVVNNGVESTFAPADEAKVEAVRAKYSLPESFFLGVGRLIPSKNILRTLEAFAEFCSLSGDTKMHFVNIGAKGTELPAIESFLAGCEYRDRIHLLSYVEQEDLPATYSAAYALVFPLLNEGFGLPAIEAMACGTPAVISKTAAPEITDEDALLVDALDVHDIMRAMRSLVDDSTMRDRVAAAGKLKAATFTWKASTDKIIRVYEELMARAQ